MDAKPAIRVVDLRKSFGTLEVRMPDQPTALGTTAALIEAVWGSRPPPTASQSVQKYVSRLRAVLAPPRERVAG